MMNKTRLARQVAAEHGLTGRQAKQIVDSIFRGMAEALEKGENVAIDKFGRFNVKQLETRRARNPRTGQELTVPATCTVGFTTSKVLKSRMNS